ncbi:MAG: GNAT family N-acetyltransferase [Propionibacteriaceae bacterium]|jgi:ribosomal protein S18 acetylase RimI-like enzyme|nr:GNAT family N-acetyltransferase [Propionibacteriaceae bacterium]
MGEVRVITPNQADEVWRLISLRMIDNIVVASKMEEFGVNRTRSGIELVGYWEDGQLMSVLCNGPNLQPINATEAALDSFSTYVEYRRCISIVGVREESLGLWNRLCQRSFTQWASPREVRDHQKVMRLTGPPQIAPSPSVHPISTRHLDAYLRAAISMYTEEVGVSPADPQGSYRDHVGTLMMKGRTFGVMDGTRVVFKADIVAAAAGICQIGGVWLAPEYRHQGFSEALMSGVVAHCQERFPTVSLYVNPYNHAALRCYKAIGFTQISECATIMY